MDLTVPGSPLTTKNPHLILASGSPRRKELLRGLGLDFQVIVSEIDEQVDSAEPERVVNELSAAKAEAVAKLILKERKDNEGSAENRSSTFILGSDTIVVLEGEILGKPIDKADAFKMLQKLSGKRHQVYTGVSLLELEKRTCSSLYQVSDVFFRELCEAEIEAYIDTKEPMDKAGSYALQGTASAFVDKIEGCYTNIIGLPIPLTVQLLRRHNFEVLGVRGGEKP